jgi:ATP-dependent Lon protease
MNITGNNLLEGSKMTRRYNLRKRREGVEWVKDDTLEEEEEDEDDSDFEEEEEESDMSESESEYEEEPEPSEELQATIKIPKGARSVDMSIHASMQSPPRRREESSDEEEEDGDEFIQQLINKYGKRGRKKGDVTPELDLNEEESAYFNDLSRAKRRELNTKMKALSGLVASGDMPQKFKILDMAIPDHLKADVIKKLDALNEMENGEDYKLRGWIEQFMRIPFGVNIPLPVKLEDGAETCSKFLTTARETMDKAVYGMAPAKTQIMQVLAQWIANPNSVGNVVALKGPMGVGKTSFARNGISEVLKRPFQFFSLGGASDSAHFTGHSFTYEGSICGRIVDAVMQSKCMNPVLYFDELDKISTTPHGEEIVSMLIHLTDRSQNSQFHDKYFAGIDFDLSQCLFVFSFNDESKIHPILKDRLQIIHCSGYSVDEKKVIMSQYVWPDLLKRLNFKESDLELSESALKFLIDEHSNGEEGVRNIIRAAEMLTTRINLLRIADADTRKTYKFGRDIVLPCKISAEDVQFILQDCSPKKDESWRSLYN